VKASDELLGAMEKAFDMVRTAREYEIVDAAIRALKRQVELRVVFPLRRSRRAKVSNRKIYTRPSKKD